MHFTTTIVAASLGLASLATAVPSTDMKRQAPVLCTGPTKPVCCSVNVLDVVDLQCTNPPTAPVSVADFMGICAAIGQEAQCCALNVVGQGILCKAPQA